MNNKLIRLTESDLHRIVKESIQSVLCEAYSDSQYAHLAGQAYGALNSFGGKVKGMFNPKWKHRKERQMQKFGDQATGRKFNKYASTNDGDNNLGRSFYNFNSTPKNYEADYLRNRFNNKKGDEPFEITRGQFNINDDKPIGSKIAHGPKNGQIYLNNDVNAIGKQHLENGEEQKYDELSNLRQGKIQLNNAFYQGKEAVKGRPVNYPGDTRTFTNNTGTNSDAFKRLK